MTTDLEQLRKNLVYDIRKALDYLGPRSVVHGEMLVSNEILSDPDLLALLQGNLLRAFRNQWISPATLTFAAAPDPENPGMTWIRWSGIGFRDAEASL